MFPTSSKEEDLERNMNAALDAVSTPSSYHRYPLEIQSFKGYTINTNWSAFQFALFQFTDSSILRQVFASWVRVGVIGHIRWNAFVAHSCQQSKAAAFRGQVLTAAFLNWPNCFKLNPYTLSRLLWTSAVVEKSKYLVRL
jgi:hypothetical protein